ncbi:MAG: SDR family NAD(P)-dependent oxidoreductase [Thermoleophilia bacterium]
MTDRLVLITGATTGIGREVAGQLAEHGATVLVSARTGARATAAAAELASRGDVRALDADLDVADAAAVANAAAVVERGYGRLDVLINNAAAYVDWTETATNADLEAAARVVGTNLFGGWRTAVAFLPLLRRSAHPRIVFVSSGAGSHADEQFGLTRRGGAAATYGISKAAVNAVVSTLAAELAGTPVIVNAVCPGLTATWPGAEQMGARPIADGAASVAWAAMLPDDGPRGGFFRDGEPLAW